MSNARPAALIKRLFFAFRRRMDQGPGELTQAQAGVMFYVDRQNRRDQPVSPSDVEEALHLSRPTVTGLVKRLQCRGFLAVETDQQDKRFKRLFITPAFESHRQQMDAYFTRQEALLMKGFSPREEEQLIHYLNRMLLNLEEGGNGDD